MERNSCQFGFYMTPPMWAELCVWADHCGQSKGSVVRDALKKHFQDLERQEEALREILDVGPIHPGQQGTST